MKKIKPHQKVLYDHAIRIFKGTLATGDKLPPLKQISQELAVDHSSLKIGLRQLIAMNLLHVKNGAIYVKDYRRCAGIDFIGILFDCQTFWPEKNILDQHTINELWAFWTVFLADLIHLAGQKATVNDIKPIMDIFDEELSNIHRPEKLIALEIILCDHVVEIADNLMVTFWYNSTMKINHKLIAMFIRGITPETFKRYTSVRKQMVAVFISGHTAELNSTIENFREMVNSIWQENYRVS